MSCAVFLLSGAPAISCIKHGLETCHMSDQHSTICPCQSKLIGDHQGNVIRYRVLQSATERSVAQLNPLMMSVRRIGLMETYDMATARKPHTCTVTC
ncbi:hypothetical protein BDR03DRAFT_956286 [Suillus americanus]|nr:hypothetical protein BDR03DRAFT_956286 [Suillus americanus]